MRSYDLEIILFGLGLSLQDLWVDGLILSVYQVEVIPLALVLQAFSSTQSVSDGLWIAKRRVVLCSC